MRNLHFHKPFLSVGSYSRAHPTHVCCPEVVRNLRERRVSFTLCGGFLSTVLGLRFSVGLVSMVA